MQINRASCVVTRGGFWCDARCGLLSRQSPWTFRRGWRSCLTEPRRAVPPPSAIQLLLRPHIGSSAPCPRHGRLLIRAVGRCFRSGLAIRIVVEPAAGDETQEMGLPVEAQPGIEVLGVVGLQSDVLAGHRLL